MEEKAAFYTAKEAAKVLRSHPYTVKRLCRETKVPAFKFGGQWRFRYYAKRAKRGQYIAAVQASFDKNYEPMREIFRLIVEQSLLASRNG